MNKKLNFDEIPEHLRKYFVIDDVNYYNNHPTTKPTNLMRWICRLLTPKGGTLLDPFMGSGSTLKAAVLENFNCIGIEMDEDYFAIAEARVAHVSPEIVEVKRTKRSIHAKQQASFF